MKIRVNTYWWNTTPNFGDMMTPFLIDRFARLNAEWATVSHADLVVGGSTLEHIPPLWDGVILGSGKLYESSELHLHTGTMKVLAIRGPLSARQCAPYKDFAIGDPGLLASNLIPVQDKVYDLGIVPHWADTDLAQRPEFYGNWETIVIDPRQPPISVICEMSRCQRIVTSSLHGLIIADSFAIPRRFEPAKYSRKAGLFKFLDYSASIHHHLEPGKMQQVARLRVEDRRYELFDAFGDLGKLFRERYREDSTRD